MARTITEIENQMLAEKANQSSLSGLTSSSQTAIWRLFIYIVAVAISVFEQILDVFKADIEATIKDNYVGTLRWIKTQCLKFQYDATTPQLLEVSDEGKLYYPVVDETKRIITRVSASTDANKNVNIKVAKGSTPTQLSAPEELALNAYLLEMMPAGVTYTVINQVSDKLTIIGYIYYNGQYASVIQQYVEDAINNYLANIDFDGAIKIIDLEMAIRNTTGVKDVKLRDVWVRANATAIGSAEKMIDNYRLSIISKSFSAGYAVEENTAGYTWADTITYVIQ